MRSHNPRQTIAMLNGRGDIFANESIAALEEAQYNAFGSYEIMLSKFANLGTGRPPVVVTTETRAASMSI